MRKIFKTIIIIFFAFPLLIWSQTYEITEIDIFSLGHLPKAEEITLYGIKITDQFSGAMQKFNKTEADLTKRGDGPFILEISTGLFIRSFDKENINSFLIRKDCEVVQKGKTSEYFKLSKDVDFLRFVVENLGKPDYHLHKDPIGDTIGAKVNLYYSNGFIFNWWDDILCTIEITSSENVQKEAILDGADKVVESNSVDDKVQIQSGWKKIAQWEGKATKNTETFFISTREWRISWETRPGEYGDMNFQIYIYKENGDLVSLAANVIGYDKDNTIIRGAGNYYLEINTAQPYTIIIEEKR